jgi:hypothetical protein
MKNDNLEQRAVAALSNDGASVQRAAAERTASWEANYGRVKAERDRLAVELATTYSQLVATLVDLLTVRQVAKELLR